MVKKIVWIVIILIIILAVVFAFMRTSPKATPLKPITQQQAQQLYNPQSNSIEGNLKGSVTLVEFFAYRCKYCRKMRSRIAKLIQQDPNLRVVYKEYLLFGQSSMLPASAALAAFKQGKYLAMHNAMLQATKPLTKNEIMRIAKSIGLNTTILAADMNTETIKQQVIENTKLAELLGIRGAPAFIFANSRIARDPSAKEVKQYIVYGVKSVADLRKVADMVQTQQ